MKFTKNKYISIFGNLDHKTLEIHDFFYNAFAKNPLDLKKEIVNEIYSEYRIFTGEIQREKGNIQDFEKKCNVCKEFKNSFLFRERYSKVYKFSYLYYCCKDCEENINSTRVIDKKNQALLARNWYEKNKELCILRAKIWRQNNSDKNRISQKKYRDKRRLSSVS
ncbi:hypothetical protein [Flavobacterium praedii]|uniref:hypothetical protein n=1 Tax=Flavobacterium praedii TaxID=3002900 RepID=UPI002481B0D2|nr:hypothetical protein [Flavobacterium praedii]